MSLNDGELYGVDLRYKNGRQGTGASWFAMRM